MTHPDDAADVVDASLADAPVIDRHGYPYIIHPLTDGVPRVPPRLLDAFATWAAALPEARDATLLVAPEAMALPLAAVLGQRLQIPYVVVRKRSYGLPGEVEAYAETGYGGSTLHLNDIRSDDRVLLVDDVLSTGGTTDALLHALDGRARVVAVAVFLEKGSASADLSARHGVPFHVMRRIRISDGRVRSA